jgi:hypothetical protein
MWLLVVAIFGMLVPNALFVYWLLNDFTTISAAFSDRLALAFTLDVFASMFVLAYLFARNPWGRTGGRGSSGCAWSGRCASASRCTCGSTGGPFLGRARA